MVTHDVMAALAAILYPTINSPSKLLAEEDLSDELRERIERSYEETSRRQKEAYESHVDMLRTQSEQEDLDPVLLSIRIARAQKEKSEHEIRLLVAYAREFVEPRPYKLADLAEAAGMSVSGVRTAYDLHTAAEVGDLTKLKPRGWQGDDDGKAS